MGRAKSRGPLFKSSAMVAKIFHTNYFSSGSGAGPGPSVEGGGVASDDGFAVVAVVGFAVVAVVGFAVEDVEAPMLALIHVK